MVFRFLFIKVVYPISLPIFFENQDEQIVRHFAYFFIKDTEYIMDFSHDIDVISNIVAFNDEIASLIMGKNTFSVKFAVREFYENTDSNIDMFSAPFNHRFGKSEIRQLKENLESLLYRHYQVFKPECYVFIANTRSKARLYQKMCDNRHPIMLDFVPITLGEKSDCFVLKTPIYQEV